jgi:hypothetical protein
MAAAYHQGRDVFPHNPVHRVHFLEGDTVFFQPDPTRYQGLALKPRISRLAEESDILESLCREASVRSMRARAWAVFLHNYSLGIANPSCACHNAFGDPHFTDLCPANPEVRAYAVALTGDIAARGVSAVVAESLNYHKLEHGFHHERYFSDLGPLGRYLLGLCFCEHCLAAGRREGIDAEELRRSVCHELELRFAADPPPEEPGLLREQVAAFAGGELGVYLDARAKTVATLVGEAAEAAAVEGAEFAFIDLAGATKGYATGRPEGAAAPAAAWEFGVDLAMVARSCGQIEVAGYASDPDRLRFDLDAYRSAIGPHERLSVILRPMAPDCESGANLASKIAHARNVGVTEVHFYHYGFMRLASLDLIHEALMTV